MNIASGNVSFGGLVNAIAIITFPDKIRADVSRFEMVLEMLFQPHLQLLCPSMDWGIFAPVVYTWSFYYST
jgi:hypothetical protein